MKQICMKTRSDSLWIKKGSLLNVLKTYLFDLGELKDFTTSDLFEAKSFNWFTYGFFEYVFQSYNIYTREAFIEIPSVGRRWYHALIR